MKERTNAVSSTAASDTAVVVIVSLTHTHGWCGSGVTDTSMVAGHTCMMTLWVIGVDTGACA